MLSKSVLQEKHTCPRRMHDIGPWPKTEGVDTWERHHHRPSSIVCGFCGSLHPDEFMLWIESEVPAVELNFSDKNYKTYLQIPEEPGGFECVVEARYIRGDTEDNPPPGDGWKWEAENEAGSPRWARYARYGDVQAKFYWMHLSDAQKQRFVDLWNKKKIFSKYGATPYFMYYPKRST